MARLFKNIHAYLGAYDPTGKASMVELDYSVDEKEVPVLTSNTIVMIPGLMKVRTKLSTYPDIGDDSLEEYVNSVIGSETVRPLSFVLPASVSTGPVLGDRGFFYQSAELKGSPVSGSVGDVHKLDIESGITNGRLVAGKLGLAKATYSSASGSATGFQLGAVSATQKLYAALHVFSVSSGGSVVVKVQSDNASNFPSSTDQITFTAATDMTSEWKEVSGAITDDWFRVTYARTGGADFVAAVLFGVAAA